MNNICLVCVLLSYRNDNLNTFELILKPTVHFPLSQHLVISFCHVAIICPRPKLFLPVFASLKSLFVAKNDTHWRRVLKLTKSILNLTIHFPLFQHLAISFCHVAICLICSRPKQFLPVFASLKSLFVAKNDTRCSKSIKVFFYQWNLYKRSRAARGCANARR